MPSRPPDRHGWNSWDSYLAAHLGYLANYQDHFLVEDRLQHTLTQPAVLWTGELICVDGYEVHVRRLQVVDFRHGVPWVKTATYSYHALRRHADRTAGLFRYDNIHAHPGHATPHHRHRYDHNGVEVKPPEHVGEMGWPTLGQVIDELHVYWEQRIG